MDDDHTRVAWPPHSYDNIYIIQQHYESVEMSSQMIDETRSIPTLIHKGQFAYEWVWGSLVDARWGAPRPRRSDQRHAKRPRAGRPYAEDNRQAQHGALCRLVWCAS